MFGIIDLKDKKILYELDKNSRQPLTILAKKVKLSQEVVFYRINKLEKKGIIKRFDTITRVSKIGFFAPKLYLQIQNISKEKFKELQEYLMNHKKIFWFGICQGRWDLIIAYWSKTPNELEVLVSELLNEFSQYISERQITIGTNTIQYTMRWFYNPKELPEELDFGTKIENYQLDKTEEEILKYLANNARLTVVELSKLIKTTPSIIRYKIKNLEQKNIIAGYKIIVDAHKLNFESCKSFIYYKNITEKRKRALFEYIKQNPYVINIVTCVGPWDLEIEFVVKSFDHFYDLMQDIKEKFSDIIKNYESVVFRDEPKKSFMPDCYPKLTK